MGRRPEEEPSADPHDALIAAQAERIAVLEALAADLRERLGAGEAAGAGGAGGVGGNAVTRPCRRRRTTCRVEDAASAAGHGTGGEEAEPGEATGRMCRPRPS